MKRLNFLLATLLSVTCGLAYADNTPNRLLVTNTDGNYNGFVIDHLDAINFARVDGEVLAKVTINEIYTDSLRVTVTRTPDCDHYKLAVLPKVTANQLNDDVTAIRYISSLSPSEVPVLWEDFDNGLLSGIELSYDTEYSLITIGIDRFGVESGVNRADFKTPAPELAGNPRVEATLVENGLYSYTVKFVPNEDVQSYWCCSGEKGVMQQQYEMFAPMFGFSNFNEMIQMWGLESKGETVKTWDDSAPSTEYEIFIAMTDKEGNFAECQVFECSTMVLGGHGEAKVDIELGNYELSEWDGEMLPTMSIQFYPNEDSACYRYGVYKAEECDADPATYNDQLCSDPWMPTAYWFFYEPMESDFQINPSTECVVIGAGRNLDKEWGEVTVLRFTTPATCDGMAEAQRPALRDITPRITPKRREILQKGMAPALPLSAPRVNIR